MTFAEYNTDENFNKPSNAMELVRLGKEEGKTREEIANSLSPLWKEDKKGNVKKALDYHFAETPKEEPKAEEQKPTEEKVTEKVIEETAPTKTVLDKHSQAYADKQSKTADSTKEEALRDIEKDSEYNWQKRYDSALKRADAYKQIDDHMVEQLPTFMFRRYQNGEFGDISDTSTPEGRESKKNAQLRLAHFMINGVGTALSNISHVIRKDGVQEQSDAEKYQQTNLEEGLRNRWNKYKADTEGAIKAVEKEYGNEQDARLAVEQFTRDHKANVKWNMMDQNQKVYALQVTKEIGSMLGGMDTSELANFIAGAALTGDMSKDEVIAIGVAKLAANAPDILAKLPEGNVKDLVMGMIGGDIKTFTAGFGGMDKEETPDNPDSIIDEKKTNNKFKNPIGNLKGYKGLDGKTYDFNTFATKEEKDNLSKISQDLSDRYMSGEIDAATYRKYLDPLVKEASKHTGIKVFDADTMIKKNIKLKLDNLNKAAKKGTVPVDSYKEQTAKILSMAEDAGYSEKDIAALKKDFKDTSKIKYKGPDK